MSTSFIRGDPKACYDVGVRVEHPWPSLPLIDFIPALSPAFARPDHLRDWLNLIERANTGTVRAMCSVPIRHWKSESTCHGVIWLLLQDPSRRIMFLTHSFEAAKKWGKRIRQLAEAMDHHIGKRGTVGPTHGWNEIAEWRNEAGGGVVVMSADQSKIGYDCHILICDDPIDEHGADDQKKRDEIDESIVHYSARCVRNGIPGSVLIVASRFHPDDPIGRRLARTSVKWEYVHRAAIEMRCEACGASVPCDDHPLAGSREHAFAPEVWGLEALLALKEELAEKDPNESLWWAQFMNDPKPIGTDLFHEPKFWSKLPDWNYRKGFGSDLAYSIGDGADWYARVAGRVYGTKLYILDVVRHKLEAHLIESTCKADMRKYGHAGFYSYMSGPEVGLARILNERGVPIVYMPARYNKLVRAQRTIKRWNDGDILVPENAPWLKGFLHRVSCFRGRERDKDDDEIDAMVSLVDGMIGGGGQSKPKAFGRAYSGLSGR